MSLTSLGDMSQILFLRRNNVEIKQQINTLSKELTTGLKADVKKAVGHDFSLLSGLERGISLSETYLRAAADAATTAQATQSSLDLVQQEVQKLGTDLLKVTSSGLESNISTMSHAGTYAVEAIVSALNTSVAGRFLFSGQATDTPPVMDAEQMLNTLRTLAQAEATTQDALAAIDAWFADGGDFSTTAYNGTAAPSAGFLVGEGETLSMGITADRSEIRVALASAVKAALLGDLSFPNGAEDARFMMEQAAEGLLEGGNKITHMRGELGQTEEAIEIAKTRANAQLTALQISRTEVLSADPYEAASALEEASTRLESLYTLTARLSRLSLTDYL